MSTITRRQVATGAAWAVPVIAVGAAAPAMASSPGSCPTVTVTSAVRGGQAQSRHVDLTFSVSPLVAGEQYILTLPPIGGAEVLGGGSVTFTSTTSPITIRVTRENNGSPNSAYTASYTLVTTNGLSCLGSVSFRA